MLVRSAIILSVAMMLSLVFGGRFPLADVSEVQSGWYYLLHKSFNHYTLWHNDIFSGIGGEALRKTLATIISTIGLSLLLFSWKRASLVIATIYSVAFHLGVYHLWGLDRLLIQSTYWLPWFCLSLRLLRSEDVDSVKIGSVAVFILGVALYFSALYLALFFALAGFVFTWSCQNWRPTVSELWIRSRSSLLFVCSITVLSCVGHGLLPQLFLPLYPSTSHVVHAGGIAGNILPLVGPTAPIPFIDRLFMKETVVPFTLVLLLVGTVFSLRQANTKPFVLIGAFLLLALDVLLPDSISQVMPLATLGRNVPFLFYMPLTMLWLWLCLFYFTIIAYKKEEYSLLALLLVVALLLPSRYSAEPGHGSFLHPHHNKPLEEFAARSDDDFAPKSRSFYFSRIISPSYPIFRTFGLWPLDAYLPIKHGRFRSLRKYPHRFSASHNNRQDMLELLSDRHLDTRWSPEGGRQRGDEWLQLFLDEPLWLYGVELFNGFFFTDYGRSLRISYLENCDGTEAETTAGRKDFRHIVSIAEWDGTLGYTQDDYLYLDTPSLVKVYFPKPIFARCLLTEQVGQSDFYDWSIARVRILRADEID